MNFKYINFYISIFIILVGFAVITNAEESKELLQKEKEYQQILGNLKNKSNTLQNELDYLDNQIELTNLKVAEVGKNLGQKNMLLSDLTNYI